MELRGQDKETIQAVSTMSCLWKLIKFSVKEGLKKRCKEVSLRYVVTSPQPVVYVCYRTDCRRSSQAKRKEGERSLKITGTVSFDFEDCYKNSPLIE